MRATDAPSSPRLSGSIVRDRAVSVSLSRKDQIFDRRGTPSTNPEGAPRCQRRGLARPFSAASSSTRTKAL
jgi:hypothetical protein